MGITSMQKVLSGVVPLGSAKRGRDSYPLSAALGRVKLKFKKARKPGACFRRNLESVSSKVGE